MASIKNIQAYVKTAHGFVPKSCWIAEIKESCGIPVKPAPNRHTLDKRENLCPQNKRVAIESALKHFGMI